MSTDDVARADHESLCEGDADAADRTLQQERDWADALALSWHEMHRLRILLAERSAQLATAQTEAHNLRDAAHRLPEALERASALENELNALRYRVAYAESTLGRFRGSFSWSVTRPLRWIGRNYRKLKGRSLP